MPVNLHNMNLKKMKITIQLITQILGRIIRIIIYSYKINF